MKKPECQIKKYIFLIKSIAANRQRRCEVRAPRVEARKGTDGYWHVYIVISDNDPVDFKQHGFHYMNKEEAEEEANKIAFLLDLMEER